MNAIVMNTLTGAVTEYTTFTFQSITPTHGGSATGLFSLGGNTDDGLAIVSRVQSGEGAWGTGMRKLVDTCYFALRASGNFKLHVTADGTPWEYSFTATGTGNARAKPGRGIRASNLSIGMSNTDGQPFTLDFIDVPVISSELRRT